MTKDQALKLALDYIVATNQSSQFWLVPESNLNKTVTAIKEALAQPEQEPLEYWNAVEGWVKIDEVREHFDSVGCATIYKTAGEGRVPLSLAKAQPEQEPVAYLCENAAGHRYFRWKKPTSLYKPIPLYARTA